MRAYSVAASAQVTLGLLLALAPHAWADNDCQRAFARWAKLSSAHIVPQSTSARGACVLTESMRSNLLEELSRAHSVCAETAVDQSSQQTRTLLGINRTFLTSLAACASGNTEAGPGWATKSQPIVVAPPPAPPPVPSRPPVAAPPPAPPKSVVAVAPPAAPPAPPKPAITTVPAPAPPCLDISPAQSDSYALVNRRCRGHTVLGVIEIRGTSGETACRGFAISQTLNVRAPGAAAPPRINYECVANQPRCNKERLGEIFPECDW
jgi:hypothetical protein